MIKKKIQMLAALKDHLGIITAAAKQAGTTRKTHYQWLKKDLEYKEAVELATEVPKDFVENRLFQLIRENNVPAVLFYMRTKMQDRGYGEKQSVDVNNNLTIIESVAENETQKPKKQKKEPAEDGELEKEVEGLMK